MWTQRSVSSLNVSSPSPLIDTATLRRRDDERNMVCRGLFSSRDFAWMTSPNFENVVDAFVFDTSTNDHKNDIP
jgi:hypothetical protein